MTHSAAATYLQAITAQIPRVISLLDREDFSRTRGCFDRTFWAWKFTDFPGARFQEGLCVLGFLYATDFPDNPYYKNAKLLHWIAGGFDFWSQIQRGTGDFDEAYPLERSLAATAFTTHYLGEAWQFVGEDLPAATQSRFREAMRLSGDWLCKNDETHGFLSNHLAAAATALYHVFLITEDPRHETRSQHFLNKILSHQSEEGWYEEYGAADPGYQTHGSYYLARYLQLSGDARLPESLDRSVQFLAHFVHPDRSLGGEYTSRNTQTYYPAAFEMLKAQSASASWVATEMLSAVEDHAAAGLGTVDIYNLYPLLNNYVFAYLNAVANADKALPPAGPSSEAGVLHFPKTGLLKVRRPRYDLYVGLMKGGVVKVFDRQSRQLVYSNCGYIGRTRKGKVISSQYAVPDRSVSVDGDEIEVHGRFYQVTRPVMDPWRFMAFRSFSLTLGRVKKAAYWIKSMLVKTLIYKKRELDLQFERAITLHEDGIELKDRLHGGEGLDLESLEPGENFTTIHMGSSRYFIPHELRSTLDPSDPFHAAIPVTSIGAPIERSFRLRLPETSVSPERPCAESADS